MEEEGHTSLNALMETVQFFQKNRCKAGAVQVQNIVPVGVKIAEAQKDVFIGIKALLSRRDLAAEIIQNVPDQRDQHVFLGTVISVKGGTCYARTLHKLRDGDLRKTFFLHQGKKRMGDIPFYAEVCGLSLVHGGASLKYET